MLPDVDCLMLQAARMGKRKQPASGGGPSQGELFYGLLLLFCELLQKFYKSFRHFQENGE